MFSVSYRDSRPIYEQLKEQAVRLIITGSLSPGDKLPSVRELAAELVINPNTIQRAYRELEADGYIYTVSGKGCFVSDDFSAGQKQIEMLFEQFDACAAKLIFSGISTDEMKMQIDKLKTKILGN